MNARFELDFQIQQFLESDHKFDDQMSQTTKDYLVEIIRDIPSISTLAIESRTRSEKIRDKTNTSQSTWSQNWAIDKSEFRKAVIKLKKNANLSSSFTKHFRQSSKVDITTNSTTISTFVNFTLKLSETLSSFDLVDQFSIADRILNERARTRSFIAFSLIFALSNFEITSSVRFFTRNFRSRSYQSSNQSFDFVFSSTSQLESDSTRSKTILDFIENSKSAQAVISNSSSFVNFSRSESLTTDKQAARHVVKHEISKNTVKLEKLTITSTRNINLIFQNVFSQSTANESSSSFTKHSSFDMINNVRNAEFETINTDESSEEIINQDSTSTSDQITNRSSSNSRSIESISGTAFSHAQRLKITDIVAVALRMNRQNNSFSRISSSDISSASSSMNTIFETRLDRWNAADLRFFDLIYDDKILITVESMQHVEKNTYFRDVHLFIERVKNFAIAKEIETVRNNLYTCLRESIMTWYTTEISEEEKELLKMKNNIEIWKRYLLKRFKERSNVAMITITRERYILENARRRRESREYADIIMRAAKSAELSSKSHLIMLIYNDLDLKFQRNIFMLELITNIQNFLQCLDDKKNIWWELINRQFTRFDTARIRNSYNTYDQSRVYQ